MNFQMFKLDLEKAEEQRSTCQHLLDHQKVGEFQKKSTSSLLTMPNLLTVSITTNCGKFFKRWEYQTCLLRNVRADQEATVRTGHGTTDWFQIGKGVRQGCILSSFLFHLYSDYILWNPGLDEEQARIKIAGRNTNNHRYADNTTLKAESKELRSLLMKVTEESENVGLKPMFRKLRSWHLIPLLHGK